jgi:hypothetical protein
VKKEVGGGRQSVQCSAVNDDAYSSLLQVAASGRGGAAREGKN